LADVDVKSALTAGQNHVKVERKGEEKNEKKNKGGIKESEKKKKTRAQEVTDEPYRA